MHPDASPSSWLPAVRDFVADNVPKDGDGDWDHGFVSALQMACELLDALGCATETHRGAMPISPPRFPNNPPRWDDTCVVVLKLSEQVGKLDFHPLDGQPSNRERFFSINTPLPPPNIAPSGMPGPSYASPDVQDVLHQLGLLENGRWTDAAETILWRNWPDHWPNIFATDPRVLAAIDCAFDLAPDDIKAEIMRLLTVKAQDMSPPRSDTALFSQTDARRRVRRFYLDWVFFKSWRLDDGWVTDHSRGRALEVFYDDLATAVCDGVVEKLMRQSS